MEATYESLQDAAGLTQLSASVKDVFANVRKQLEVLEDRLEEMVQPRLSDAFTHRKVESVQELRQKLYCHWHPTQRYLDKLSVSGEKHVPIDIALFMARDVAHMGIHPPEICVGTPRWMAPEVVQAMHQRNSYGLMVNPNPRTTSAISRKNPFLIYA